MIWTDDFLYYNECAVAWSVDMSTECWLCGQQGGPTPATRGDEEMATARIRALVAGRLPV
jgi:hypothetical protein